MKRTFRARKGSWVVSNKKAQPYGEELHRLAEKAGGKLTPHHVVKKAKSKRSPLHDYFEWNDSKAAIEYRVFQARQLMGAIEIVIGNKQLKAFPNLEIPVTEEDCAEVITQSYIPLEIVIGDEFFLNQLIEQAHGEMAAWGKRYREYKSLKGFKKFKPIFKEIDQLQLT